MHARMVLSEHPTSTPSPQPTIHLDPRTAVVLPDFKQTTELPEPKKSRSPFQHKHSTTSSQLNTWLPSIITSLRDECANRPSASNAKEATIPLPGSNPSRPLRISIVTTPPSSPPQTTREFREATEDTRQPNSQHETNCLVRGSTRTRDGSSCMTGMANVPLSRCTIRAQPAGRTETTGRAVSPRAYTCPEEFIAKHSGVRASEVIGKVDTVKGLGDSNRRSQVHTIPNALPE